MTGNTSPPRGIVWLNPRDAAMHLGISRTTLDAKSDVSNPDCIPCYKRGKIVRYRVSDLDDWLLQKTTANTADNL